MLKIRNEQMTAFEQAALKNFEDRTIEHLREYFPKHCEVFGEANLRQIIQLGLKRSQSYGVVAERGVRVYIDLMLLLGSGFAEDPQLPWASEILKDETIADESVRIDRLYEKAMSYLDHVSGVNNEHIDEAQRRLSQQSVETFSESPIADTSDFAARLQTQLKEVFPEKCKYIGDTSIGRLIALAQHSAEKYRIKSERGVAVLTTLMFMLGSGVDADSQVPWVAAVLNDESIADEKTRVERLYKDAMTYLAQWCG